MPSVNVGLLKKFENKESQDTVRRWFIFLIKNRRNYWDNVSKEDKMARSKMMIEAKAKKKSEKL